MLANKDFVHLHNHTDVSVQDALPKPKSLAMKAREMGFTAVGLTDHGKMGGIVEFVDACRTPHDLYAPIKPIIGCEVYTCPDRLNKQPVVRPDGTKGRPKHNHLTLLAMNQEGYRNLCNISSIGAEEGMYYDPRVDRSVIQPHSGGIIAASGCLGGEVNQYLLRGEDQKAEESVAWFKEVFADRYYLELHNHGIEEQRVCNPKLVELGKKFGIPCIIANDTHYLEPNDWEIHDVLIQMRDLSGDNKGKVNGKKRAYATKQFWLKSAEEMAQLNFLPSHFTNTLDLAERVEDFMKLDVPHLLPSVHIPLEDTRFRTFYERNLPHHSPKEAYLAFLAMDGLRALGLDRNDVYTKRLKYELSVIWHMGVVDYFLIQNEMVQFMKDQDILYGIRGSGVGSLVLYAMGVNRMADPVRFDLMFERFLNPGRGTQYRIDLSCYAYKQYLEDHGKEDQAQAVLRLKKLVKENITPEMAKHRPMMDKELWVLENQGRATYLCHLADNHFSTQDNECNLWCAYFLGITTKEPEGEMIVSKIATLPDVDTDIDDSRRGEVIEYTRQKFGPDRVAMISTRGTYQTASAVAASLKVSPYFQSLYGDRTHEQALIITKEIPKRQQPPMTLEDAIDLSPRFSQWADKFPHEIEVARRLIGTISHMGVHAGGVIVSSKPIRDTAPLENSKGVIASAYDMSSVERVGLVKYDYLGLATYQMLARALKHIKKRHGITIDLTRIDLDDKKVLKLYKQGKTSSIFQFASGGMQKTLRDVQADTIHDLIAVAALYRPGPLEFIPEYAQGKHANKEQTFEHEIIAKHLAYTFGVMVYQEQAMMLGLELAGLDWDEVDKLRKSVSKKDPIGFEKITKVFREKAITKQHHSEAVVDGLINRMKKFSGYAFNKSHSTVYAILSYYTAFLRAYYPAEWLAACFQVDHDNEDKMALYRRECELEGVPLQRPNVNESSFETVVTSDGHIILPLTSIKGVGSQAQGIIDAQPYENLKDLVYRARPNAGVIKSLIEADALDCFYELRQKEHEDILVIFEDLVVQRTNDDKHAALLAGMKYTSVSPMLMHGDAESDDMDDYVNTPSNHMPTRNRLKTAPKPVNRVLSITSDKNELWDFLGKKG